MTPGGRNAPEGRKVPLGDVVMNITCPKSVDGLKLVWDHLLGNKSLDEWNLPTLGSPSISDPSRLYEHSDVYCVCKE